MRAPDSPTMHKPSIIKTMAEDHDPTETPLPGAGMNLQDADVVIDLFQRATEASLNHPLRSGSHLALPDHGQLMMTGDLHDNGLNLQRLLKLARLQDNKDHHIVLHELIHGEHKIEGRDLSVRIFAKVAALKCDFPDQVHLMLGNHELSQLGGDNILKGGISVVQVFDDGVDFIYADRADDVREAMNGLIRAMLLAVRCPNGIFCSHSLPSPRMLSSFDSHVIDRQPTDEDYKYPGSAYAMVWGRQHNQALADDLADDWQCDMFVMGHQPADFGYYVEADTMLVIASDHNHGVALPIDLARKYTMDDLVGELIPLASVVL